MSNIEKSAVIGGIIGGHLAQNAIGVPLARSERLKKSLSRAALSGALNKKNPRNIKSLVSDMGAGVFSPEINAAKNQAYSEARKMSNKHSLADKVRSMTARQKVIARAALTGDKGRLKRIGASNNPIVNKVRKHMDSVGVKGMDIKDIKRVTKMPSGNRAPSSNKAAVAANVAIAPIPVVGSAAYVNAAKLAAGSDKVSNSKLGKSLTKKMIHDPVKKSLKAGKSGSKFNTKAHIAASIGINPFTAEAKRVAHSTGKKLNT